MLELSRVEVVWLAFRVRARVRVSQDWVGVGVGVEKGGVIRAMEDPVSGEGQ